VSYYEQGRRYGRELVDGTAPEIDREGILEMYTAEVRKGVSHEVIQQQEAVLYARIYGTSLDAAKAFVRGVWEVVEQHLSRFEDGVASKGTNAIDGTINVARMLMPSRNTGA
jgi:hypothetical protein